MYRNFSSFKGFWNVLEVSHYIDGRMRLYVPSVNQWKLVEEVKKFLESKSALKMNINPITKSLLVFFDAKEKSPYEIFFLIVRALEKIGAISLSQTSAFQKQFSLGSKLLNRGIYERTQGRLDLWGCVPMLYLFFSIKSLIQGGSTGQMKLSLLNIFWHVWSFWFSNHEVV